MTQQKVKLTENQRPLSPGKHLARLAGWMSFGVFCLILFTLFKLPEDRIKAYIDGSIGVALADKGITFHAAEGHLSFIFGLSYTMTDITLNLPPPSAPVHFDKIEMSPSILSLLFLNYRGKVWIKNGKGDLSAAFTMKNNQISLSYKANQLDLQKLGILPILVGFQAAAIIDGTGSLSGDYTNPSSLEGEAALTLSQITIEAQSIAGFSIPQLFISDAVADLKAEKGKITLKTLRVGKATPTQGVVDDIQGALTGDVTLAKQAELSQLNIKLHFTFSEKIMKAFVLIDSLLGPGKQADGSYSYSLTGPILSPSPTPGGSV